jgi:hypothetical protein
MFGPVPACLFKADGAMGSVNVTYVEHGDRGFDQLSGTMVKGAVPIADAGTKAVRNNDGTVMVVLANGHVATVVRMGANKDRPLPSVADDLAKTVAGRL